MNRLRVNTAALAAFARLDALTMHRLSLHNSGGAEAAAAAAAATATTDAGAAGAAAEGAAAAAAATGGEGAAAAAGAGAAGEAAKGAAAAVPENYELKLPDGSTLGADFVTRTADFARALGLNNEAGQKLLDAQVAEVSQATAAARDAAKAEQVAAMQPGGAVWNELEAKWAEQSLADTEIGGSPEKLKANVDLANKVVNRFATDDAKKFFQDSGLGSHPELIRVFARIGSQMSEATLVRSNSSTSAQLTEDEKLAKRYPTMVKQS